MKGGAFEMLSPWAVAAVVRSVYVCTCTRTWFSFQARHAITNVTVSFPSRRRRDSGTQSGHFVKQLQSTIECLIYFVIIVQVI